MDYQSFCYWLHGFTEIGGPQVPTSGQWDIIKDHLALALQPNTPNVKPYLNYDGILPYC